MTAHTHGNTTPRSAGRDSPAFRIHALSFIYPDGARALHGISLEIGHGERVGIVGANGAGKSTLMLHLNGILRGEGVVEVYGLPVRKRTLSSIRRMVGLVFQNPDDQLFCPTVGEDVAFGPRNLGLDEEEVRRRVTGSLEAVGLAGFQDRSPLHLSIGERKRAAIATVHAMHPRAYLFDEPASSLDPRGRRLIMELMARLEGTLLIITHDLAMVRRLCDRAVVLKEGTLAADGRPTDLFGDTTRLLDWGLA